MKSWYYASNGQPSGPFQDIDIKELISDGLLTRETLVWSDAPGDAERGWVRVSETELSVFFYSSAQPVFQTPLPPSRPSNFNEYQPKRQQLDREEKPKFRGVSSARRYALYAVGGFFVFLFAAVFLSVVMDRRRDSRTHKWEAEICDRITFKIESSWKKQLTADGIYSFYPADSGKTEAIVYVWREVPIGSLSAENTRAGVDSGISAVMERFQNVKEINRAYFKIGDNYAARVSFYYENNGINGDKLWHVDLVTVVFEDGIAMLFSNFTETKYESYKDIIETALNSVELARRL